MSHTLARLRSPGPILLSYAGALLVLFGLVSLYSPGFADPTHVTTLLIVAAFIGIVAIGQTDGHHRWRHRPVGPVDAQLRGRAADRARPERGRPR